MNNSLNSKFDHLLDLVTGYQSCAVAFSGGVDSAVIAMAAHKALGEQSVAVTAVSASLAESELSGARTLAEQIGIRHIEMPTDEISNPGYTANAPDRCFHCKTELYGLLSTRLEEFGVQVIANGANADDLRDYRPGHQAAEQFGVVSPLAECEFSKADVRELARHWGLEVAEKPAAPCLASRIAYGQEVTEERLKMIELAEQTLRQFGLGNVRVRYHADDLARLEVPLEAIQKIAEPSIRVPLVQELKRLGFKFLTLDLEGFRSGSMNTLVPLEDLTRFG